MHNYLAIVDGDQNELAVLYYYTSLSEKIKTSLRILMVLHRIATKVLTVASPPRVTRIAMSQKILCCIASQL